MPLEYRKSDCALHSERDKFGRCRECMRAHRARYNAANRDAINSKSAVWRANNRARHRVLMNAWKAKNKDRVAEQCRARQAALLNRSPAWANRNHMAGFYKIARFLTQSRGIYYTVDHVVPLQGKRVSGLHVPENLAITKDNFKKSNKWEV